MEIPRRISQAVLNSLQAGVVPRVGLEYIAVGRKKEIETVLDDLDYIAGGAAAFRFITGRYGSGKSFFLQAIRNYAMEKDFVVVDADLSPDKRLAGSAGAGRATYRELMQRLSTKVRPDGGALEGMLQKWISSVQAETIRDGYSREEREYASRVEWKLFQVISEMEAYSHGFDFAAAAAAYFKAFSAGDDGKKEAALRWFRGEYSGKTEARRELPVGEIIGDHNWYDHLKLFAAFVSRIGYRGLLVFIDEGVNLFKITNRVSRENNYEKLLAIFNDITQGRAASLGFLMAGTPQFIDDPRRGLASYPALRSRLEESRFVRMGHADWGSPVLRLTQLANEEVFVLLERLVEIHSIHHNYESWIGEDEIRAFMELAYSVPGAAELITPREITRDFIGLLNILKDDEDLDFYELIKRDDCRVQAANPEELYASFSF
ncbi:MAG: ATP-binding protein [Treponema sp.]|jgi:hypothetical protein|nr:ATP-binding protein [Treponema sp.]